MYKNIYRNMTTGDFNRHSKYFPERLELHSFNGSADKTVGFEYENVRQAYNACNMLKLYAKRVSMPVNICQRRSFVIASKKTD